MKVLEILGSLAFFALTVGFIWVILALMTKTMKVNVRSRGGGLLASPETFDNIFKKEIITRDLSRMILYKLSGGQLTPIDRSLLLATDADEAIINHKRKVIQHLYSEKMISEFELKTLEKELVRNGNDGSDSLPF